MSFQAGGHNGHTLYYRTPAGEPDYFVGICMSPEAASWAATQLSDRETINEMARILPTLPRLAERQSAHGETGRA